MFFPTAAAKRLREKFAEEMDRAVEEAEARGKDLTEDWDKICEISHETALREYSANRQKMTSDHG